MIVNVIVNKVMNAIVVGLFVGFSGGRKKIKKLEERDKLCRRLDNRYRHWKSF